MLYRVLADGVVIVHLGYIAFVATGALLSWRWRRLLWLHVPAVAWAVVIVVLQQPCPLTPLEKRLRRAAGDAGYPGGFIDHYLTGVIYPHGWLGLAQALVAAAVVVGYAGLILRSRRRAK